MATILGFHCHGPGSIPGQGTEILKATQHGQKKKKKKLEGNLRLIKECLVSLIIFKGNKAGIIYIKSEIVIAYVENSHKM